MEVENDGDVVNIIDCEYYYKLYKTAVMYHEKYSVKEIREQTSLHHT
jgi:hypothetical protein